MSTRWQQLAAMWREAGIKVRPGVTSTDIRAFENKNEVVLPADLREYFLTVDGMEDELDPGTNRFWPLGMVKLVSEELKDIHSDRWSYPGCFIFADHCIWCLAWAVRLGREPLEISEPVFQVTGDKVPGRMIAPSFTAFVEMYLANQYRSGSPPANHRMKLTRAAILVSRGMKVLQAAPAAYPYRSAAREQPMTVNQIVSAFLAACPGLASAWQEHLAFWAGEEDRGIYNDVAVIGQYLVDRVEAQDVSEFPSAFSLLERCLAEEDSETREVAKIGIIEAIQNIAPSAPRRLSPGCW